MVQACHHQASADLQSIIDAGRGDVPVRDLRFRCTECGSSLTDSVVNDAGRTGGAALAAGGGAGPMNAVYCAGT
jgi:hypothetical protein